ncbi:MAG: citrate/2-methylcitrate synthase [Clostridiales bacterium]|mgnify:CR=1 FL=1|nr:citrate/2-methylcitrate synthase [Clostridiales bacterium]
MSNYISPISDEEIAVLSSVLTKHNVIRPTYFDRFSVKRGLRNPDGTGVMAGLTKICSVDGYYISDGERVPSPGKLIYRGINMQEIVDGCQKEERFGYEEVVWLLLFGRLPNSDQLSQFKKILSKCRELPEDFIEDMIMKAPSPDIMNKMARSVMALYSYDENPDDLSAENVLRQSIQLIAQLPTIMSYAYQVKRRHYYHKSMYIHPLKPEHSTAEAVLHFTRSDRKFTEEEARLLDLCLIIHAEHGGGNNSTFATRVLSSAGTDTYSAIAAGIGSLKGPKHGGANIKVAQMIRMMKEEIANPNDEGQVADYLVRLINREVGDRSGLVYGMGHAVYTLSDPRSAILKENARHFAMGTEYEEEYKLIELVERLSPKVFYKAKGDKKKICANVDLYSGLVYKMLNIPEDLYTPLFTVARVAGWAAHRLEELLTCGRIIRPAYKSVSHPRNYVPLADRREAEAASGGEYIPKEERW